MSSNQRWRDRRSSMVGGLIDPSRYDVEEIPGDDTAREFVLRHHYSGSYPAARFRFGLYAAGALAGVAVFSHPVSDKALLNALPIADPRDGVDLGRFVLLDEVPGNGETWFLARCFERLRRDGLAGVIAFSDPLPRRGGDGGLVMPGHVGTIYQAHNAAYLGRAVARTLLRMPSGKVLHSRRLQKLRRREQGWEGAVAELVSEGARRPGRDWKAWLRYLQEEFCERVRHRGNHKYAWSLHPRVRLPQGRPYPKQIDPEA